MIAAVAALDSSGEWALDAVPTCAHWVARALDVEVSTAREWVRVGRALAELDVIDRAFADGSLSYSKVRVLSRVATGENQQELCDMARRVPAGRLAAALAAWLARRETPQQTERRQRAARSLSWRVDVDGMVVGAFRLAPLDAAVVTTAVDAVALRSRPVAVPDPKPNTHSDVDASAGASTPPTVVWPSVAQQRADALVEIVCGGGTRVLTEVVLHVRGDGCTLDDGTPVAGSVVERIATRSFIRALIHDAQSRPINASARQRHPTARQRRVIKERDRACVDCGTTENLEYDHDPDWEITHHTTVKETILRCRDCHRRRHDNPNAA